MDKYICRGARGGYMKKIVFLLLVVFAFDKVLAQEVDISYRRLDGIYFNLTVNDSFLSNHVTSFYFGDRLAYCIEPGVEINTSIYDTADWSVTSFSEELKKYIELVGYYGYEYPGHNNDYYYIAAQELIWRAINPNLEIVWTTAKNMDGSVIDVSSQKEEIESMVNKHLLKPSFLIDKVEGYVGEEIILSDTNNVLHNYEFSSSSNHLIEIIDNKLKIKLNSEKVPDETIVLHQKHYDFLPLIVYENGDSQKLAALRISFEDSFSFVLSNKEYPYEEVVVPNTGKNYFFESLFYKLCGKKRILYF